MKAEAYIFIAIFISVTEVHYSNNTTLFSNMFLHCHHTAYATANTSSTLHPQAMTYLTTASNFNNFSLIFLYVVQLFPEQG